MNKKQMDDFNSFINDRLDSLSIHDSPSVELYNIKSYVNKNCADVPTLEELLEVLFTDMEQKTDIFKYGLNNIFFFKDKKLIFKLINNEAGDTANIMLFNPDIIELYEKMYSLHKETVEVVIKTVFCKKFTYPHYHFDVLGHRKNNKPQEAEQHFYPTNWVTHNGPALSSKD